MSQQTTITTLQNGLTLVLQPMSTSDNKLNISFLFNGVGNVIDGDKPGIAHLAEHMVFRGTNVLSAKDISQKITYLSHNDYTAYTDYDKTVFQLNAHKNSLNDAVALLVDMFSKSTLNDFETEKSVIKHELNDRLDNSIINLFTLIDSGCGLKNHDLLQKENLSMLTKDDVQTFIKENYIPNKCQLIISGAIEDMDIVEAVIKSKTKNWQNSSIPHQEWTPLEYKPGYFVEEANSNCARFSLFFNGPKSVDIEDFISRIIVSTVSGSMLNSVMMHDGRINQGLAYDIKDFYISYPDHGFYGVITWTDKESFTSLLQSTISSMKSVRSIIADPRNSDVDMAKILLKDYIQRPNITAVDAAEEYIQYSNLGLSRDEIIDIIDKTTTQDILNWLDSTFESGPSLAVYGDIDPNIFSYDSLNELWNGTSDGFLN